MTSLLVGENHIIEKKLTKISYNGVDTKNIEISPHDLSAMTMTFGLTICFETDIQGETLEKALRTVGEEYVELFGRLVPHESLWLQIKVSPDSWIPFLEQKSDLTLHDAFAKYGRSHSIPADSPTRQKVPFFCDVMDISDIKNGVGPLFHCKLTHFSDGCCALHCTVSHAFIDGQRYADLLNDIGRAARNEKIGQRLHDRKIMWPDEFLKKVSVPNMCPELFPKMTNPSFDYFKMRLDYFPDQTYSLHALHFPEEVIKKTKETLSKHLQEGEYLSTADIISAVIWLLYCEAEVPRMLEKGVENGLQESLVQIFAEASQNGVSFVPKNYLGNAFLYLQIRFRETHSGFEKNSLMNLFLNTALSFRKKILSIRKSLPSSAANLAFSYTVMNNPELVQPMLDLPVAATVSSYTKLNLETIDFGSGTPCFISSPSVTPPLHNYAYIMPGLKSGGIIASLYLLDSKKKTLLQSKVLKECVPGVRFIFSEDVHKQAFNLDL